MKRPADLDLAILVEEFQMMQRASESLAVTLRGLVDQMRVAEGQAQEAYRKVIEERCDVGGEA